MKNDFLKTVLLVSVLFMIQVYGFADQTCMDCHDKRTPGLVNDWRISRHGENGIECSACHGGRHQSAEDVEKVEIPTPETCEICHERRAEQYKKGKHALAWTVMKAMPTMHWQPAMLTEGMKGCGGCHKIGLKTVDDIKSIKGNSPGFGTASCDSCHTRHVFSVKEARQPQACQTCHMGFDHPQWEMYASSKHGVRYLLKQKNILADSVSAPTCQTCHMPEQDHEVRTAWGFLAVRLPMPEDKQWAKDRTKILQALHVLNPEGSVTERYEIVKGAQLARLTQDDWERERSKMIDICNQCHSRNFARAELEKGDQMIREADHLMAQAIDVVSDLYRDKIIVKPESYEFAFPDLLTFHDARTPVEQRLFVMFLKHRMRAFQGSFHSNPDYALWYGWSALKQDLTEIKHMAQELRRVNHMQRE